MSSITRPSSGPSRCVRTGKRASVNFLLRFAERQTSRLTVEIATRLIAGAGDQCAKSEDKEKDDKKRVP